MDSQQNKPVILLSERKPPQRICLHHYAGIRKDDDEVRVTVSDVGNGAPRVLPPRNDLVNHSPDGFEWGYLGSGPAQLAFALCLDALEGNESRARRVYQDFKSQIVVNFPRDFWEIDSIEILDAIDLIESNGQSDETRHGILAFANDARRWEFVKELVATDIDVEFLDRFATKAGLLNCEGDPDMRTAYEFIRSLRNLCTNPTAFQKTIGNGTPPSPRFTTFLPTTADLSLLADIADGYSTVGHYDRLDGLRKRMRAAIEPSSPAADGASI